MYIRMYLLFYYYTKKQKKIHVHIFVFIYVLMYVHFTVSVKNSQEKVPFLNSFKLKPVSVQSPHNN